MVGTAMKSSKGGQRSTVSVGSSRRTPKDAKTPSASRLTSRRTVSRKSRDAISDDEFETEEEQLAKLKSIIDETVVTGEYIQASRFLKYAKIGNPTATVLALVALDDLGCEKDSVQACIVRSCGISLLVNLIKSTDLRSKIASLKILSKICINKVIAAEVINSDGVEVFVQHLSHQNIRVAVLSAETLSCLALLRIGRNLIRSTGGLEILLNHLQYASECILVDTRRGTGTRSRGRIHNGVNGVPPVLVQATACAVWYSCRSSVSRSMVVEMDAVRHLENLLALKDQDISKPIVGVINHCAEEPLFRKNILTGTMIRHLIYTLKSTDKDTQLLAMQAIEKCCVEPEVRSEIQRANGLPYILVLLQRSKKESSMFDLLEASTGAVLGCMADNEYNINWFCKENIIEKTTPLLQNHPVKVISNALGILQVIAQYRLEEIPELKNEEILTSIMQHLQNTDERLLVAVNGTAAEFAKHEELREEMIQGDALRLLWSELKSSKTKVVASAATAIYYMITDQEETAEHVRSFVGGIELLLKLLKSDDREVLAPICDIISRLALDDENLTIMDDYDLPVILQELVYKDDLSTDIILSLCRCLQSCCANGQQRVKLRSTIKPLGEWLENKDPRISKEATHALHMISKNPDNCMLIYQHGVVKHLMYLICSDDEELQENAAICLRNIRWTIVDAAEGQNRPIRLAEQENNT